MTDKEAIEILKDLWRWEHPNWLEKDIRQALDKGVEALEKLNAIETIINTDYVQEDVFKYKAIVNTVKENKQWQMNSNNGNTIRVIP